MNKPLQNILCIDDEVDVLDVIQLCLETLTNFQVNCCHSGAEALAYTETHTPDLILLDVMMPDMDGPSTLKALRKNSALKETPIIFITARIQASEIQAYLETGAIGVISKPFDPMLLPNEIIELWDAHYA